MLKKNPSDNLWLQFGIYSAMGIQLVLCVIGGLYLGELAESKWNISPWGLITGSVLGMIIGFINLMRLQSWKEKKMS